MSFMTVPNCKWNGMSFLYCDVGFNFVSDMCIEVTSIDVDIFGSIVGLLGQWVKVWKNSSISPSLGLIYTPVMWIGRAIQGDLIVQDTAWCEDPFAPSVIRCCSTFRLDAF